ncbi:MAG TPA: protein kinase [Ktedonobacteraceae bacterium]
MTDSMPLDPETSIGGHYIIDALISRGGFGAVYRGIDTSEGDRPCAIKETYDVTPAARRRALMEAAVLFTVKSKHLPRVYDAFESNGRFYLVMQLIEGQTLQQLLKQRRSPCSEQEVLTWLLPIMHVLNELHSRNPAVIHRDIKPGNIILTPDQTAVLVDFGLTKLYDPNSDTPTMVRAVSGGYSPVEQYVGKTSQQSDIYAMAATIYFLLTLQVPPASINRSYRDEIVAPRLLNPLLSPTIEHALLKALSVDADQRYSSMDEFAQAMQNPPFTAHADPTISNSIASIPYAYTQGAISQVQSQPPGIDRQTVPRPAPAPAYQYGSPQPSAYPMLPANPVTVPPARVTQNYPPPAQDYRPLPSPFSQGCLWGLLQGLLAAFIVLILKKDVYFYLAIVEGFLFFMLAGFLTTRKGGKLARGAWAGFWAGVVSTLVFWVVGAIGFAVLVSQRIAADTAAAQRNGIFLKPDIELNQALRVVGSTLPIHPANPSSGTNVVIFLIGGLLCAIGFGLLGGVLGKSRFRAKMQKRGYL